MKAQKYQIGVLVWLVTALSAPAAIHYVDVNGTAPLAPYTNWASAATNIQDAVNASSAGDQILVTNGVYGSGGTIVFGAMSNRVAVTVPVTIQSANGPDATIIQGSLDPTNVTGDAAVRGIYLTNGAALIGFTISGGATRNTGDATNEQCGGGVFCASTNVTLENCVITGNLAVNAGGVYGGYLTNCIISSNSAGFGAGANSCTLVNCTLNNNSGSDGGGAENCTLSNCTLFGNSVSDGGGGADFSTVINCLMTNNFAYEVGGGAYASTVSNSVFAGNSANAGGGSGFCSVFNSVLTGNTGGYGGGVLGGSLNNCTVTGSAACWTRSARIASSITIPISTGIWTAKFPESLITAAQRRCRMAPATSRANRNWRVRLTLALARPAAARAAAPTPAAWTLTATRG